MNWLITAGVEEAIRGSTYAKLSTSVGVAVIALLVGLLLLRDMRRVTRGRRAAEAFGVIDVLLGPLVVAFPALVVIRLLILLQ